MAYETIKYEVAEQILTITLNRPDKLNAFNGTMQQELIAAFDAADKDDGVRAIIVTGAGRGFCAGADLSSGAKLSGVDVVRGFNQTMAIRAAAAKLFCDLDYVVSPVAPVVNFPAEFASPLNDPEKPFEHICYTVPWNMSENPAASINGGYDKKGFPIGVQIVGRRFDDIGVLGMAKAFEGLRGAQKPWPSPPKK